MANSWISFSPLYYDHRHAVYIPAILDLVPNLNRMKEKVIRHGSSSNAVYGLGFIGAAIYYISVATNFWMGLLGFLKAILWPAFLVYEALKELAA